MPRGVCAPAFPFPKALPGLSKDAGECPRRCPASPWKPCRASPRWLNAIAQQSPEARGIHPCPFQGFESCPRMPSGILGFHKGIASPPQGIFQKILMSSPRIPPGNVPMNWERSPHGLCTRPPGFPKTVAQELTEEFTESHSEICSYLPRIPQGTRPEMPPRMHQTQPGLCTNNQKSPQNLAGLPTGVCITCSRVPGRAPGDVPPPETLREFSQDCPEQSPENGPRTYPKFRVRFLPLSSRTLHDFPRQPPEKTNRNRAAPPRTLHASGESLGKSSRLLRLILRETQQ